MELIKDFDEITSNFDTLLEQVEDYYKNDKLFMAYKALKRLENSLTYHQNEGFEDQVSTLKTKLYKREFTRESIHRTFNLSSLIHHETEETKKLIYDFQNHEEWALVREANGIKSFYKSEKDNPVISIKIEGVIDAPIFNILAIVYETDLYSTWFPLLKECSVVTQLSKYRKSVYMRVDLPWPMSGRDACLYGYGVDILEEDMILVVVRSCTNGSSDTSEDNNEDTHVHNEEELYNMPKLSKKYVRMSCNIGGVLCKPLSPTSTLVTFVNNADPKLALPYWFLNFMTKQLSHHLFEMLRTKASSLKGSEYEKRIDSRPEVYGEIKTRIDEHFSNKDNLD